VVAVDVVRVYIACLNLKFDRNEKFLDFQMECAVLNNSDRFKVRNKVADFIKQ
jgi:hypothetical protein